MNTTLYNLTFGALGALILLLGVRAYQLVGRLGIGTRLRSGYRRLIGMTHFEELVLNEMRTYRRDVDFYTRGLPTTMQLSTIDKRMEQHRTTLQAERTRNNRLRKEVEELGILLHSYTETLGPIWNTASGHRMPMRLLSSGHLKNIIDGNFGGYDARRFAMGELERRSIDTAWRVKMQQGEPVPTKQDYIMGRVPIDPSIPMTYTLQVASRVARVLPQWAQDIIAGLLQPEGLPIKRAERARIKKLPLWAQQTIKDLEQPR